MAPACLLYVSLLPVTTRPHPWAYTTHFSQYSRLGKSNFWTFSINWSVTFLMWQSCTLTQTPLIVWSSLKQIRNSSICSYNSHVFASRPLVILGCRGGCGWILPSHLHPGAQEENIWLSQNYVRPFCSPRPFQVHLHCSLHVWHPLGRFQVPRQRGAYNYRFIHLSWNQKDRQRTSRESICFTWIPF